MMADTKIPAFSKGCTYSDWDRRFSSYISTKRRLHVWVETSAPDEAPTRLPIATSAAAIIAKVKPIPAFRTLIGLRASISLGGVDEDIIDEWSGAAAVNRQDITEFRARKSAWPTDVSEVIGYIGTSCELFAGARRVIAAVLKDEHQ